VTITCRSKLPCSCTHQHMPSHYTRCIFPSTPRTSRRSIGLHSASGEAKGSTQQESLFQTQMLCSSTSLMSTKGVCSTKSMSPPSECFNLSTSTPNNFQLSLLNFLGSSPRPRQRYRSRGLECSSRNGTALVKR
jgi:hypothetical protein